MPWVIPRKGHEIIRSLIEPIVRKRFINKNLDLNDTIVLSGSPRSGTTWLMEIIKSLPGYTHLFEPLNPDWFPEVKEINYAWGDYISPDSEWKRGEEFFTKVFNGSVYCKVPHFDIAPSNIIKRIFAEKLVIKFIRANKILHWIANNFDLKSIIYMIRHPCSTIDSQIRSKVYSRSIGNITKRKIVEEMSKTPYIDSEIISLFVEDYLETEISKLAAIWYLDNIVPLQNKKSFIFTTYEDLIMNGKSELNRIFKEMGIGYVPEKTINILNRPSTTSDKTKNDLENKKGQLTKWKKNLSINEIDEIFEILSIFGFDKYDRSPMPRF